jgi:glycosyltransferase involved in cell wall biosynthesis
MNVVLLTPGTGSYYCGVCMRDNALAKELVREGHDAIMLPMYLPLTLDETAASPDTPVFYGGINVYLQQKSSWFARLPRWIANGLNHPALLRLAGKRSGMTSGADLGALTVSMMMGEEGRQAAELEKLMDWLKNESGHADAIWLSTLLLAGLARRMKAELGVPVLASLQGEDGFLDSLPPPWRERAWQTLAERTRDLDRLIAPSRFYAEFMHARLGMAPDAIRVIPNGISLEEFRPEIEPPGTATIGFLARFIAEKGLGLVIDAFIELKRRQSFPGAKLRCAGAMTAEDARYVSTLQSKLEAAGVARDVEFLPNVTRAEKIAFLETINLLSVPTQYPEAFGLFLLEAMAAARPVVQPRAAAFTELVEGANAGILVAPQDTRAMVDGWETLLRDPVRARELGRNGRNAIERDFTVSRMAHAYLDATREVMDVPAAAR